MPLDMGIRPGRSVAPLMATLGGVALAAQSLLARELMVSFYGTELSMACALAFWLLFVSLGALAGAGLLRRVSDERPLLYGAAVAAALGLHGQFLLARLVRPLFGVETGEFVPLWTMLGGAALAAAPVAFAVGLFFPVAAGHEAGRGRLRAAGVSRIYVAEAVGSGAAGALLSLYLLGRLGPVEITFGAAAVLLFVAGWLAAGAGVLLAAVWAAALAVLFSLWAGGGHAAVFFFLVGALAAVGAAWLLVLRRPARGDVAASVTCVGLGLAVCATFLGWGRQVERASTLARWRTFSRFELVAEKDTRYQHAAIGEREGTFVLVQDGYRTLQFPDPWVARGQAALLLTEHPRPQRVLVIGGGLGGLCQQLLQAPIGALDYVEPDPQLMGLVYDHLPRELKEPLHDPRFLAFNCDGRYFVQRCRRDPVGLSRRRFDLDGDPGRTDGARRLPAGSYDLAIVNTGDPTSASASRFFTAEFCRELRAALSPGGAAAFCGISASENYARGTGVLQYTACLYRTIRSVFDHVVVRPGDSFCFFAAARPGVVSSEPSVLADRFDRLGLGPEGLKYAFELEHFPPERVEWVRRVLEEARPTALLNTDARPVAFTLFLRFQARFAGGAAGATPERAARPYEVFQWVRAVRPFWFITPFAAALAGVLLLAARRNRLWACRSACGFSIFTTGVLGLAAELLLLYGYQTAFGFVYRDISVIVGLFMAGLAVGGAATGRWPVGRPGTALVAVEGAGAVFILSLPIAAEALSFSPWAFMALSPVAGFLTGAAFPLAVRVALASGGEAGTVSGLLDSADHLGALTAAVCVGLLLVPALGIVQSAALLAVIKCASLLGVTVAVWLPERRAAGLAAA